MTARPLNRRRRAAAGIVGLALAATACGTGGSSSDQAEGDPDASLPAGCEDFADYAGSSGTQVSMYTSIRDIEADRYVQSFEEFEKCTGITINYEGSGEFEAQLNVKVQGGNAPDLAFIPQPVCCSASSRPARSSRRRRAPRPTSTSSGPRPGRSTARSTARSYAAPMGANVKSYVWYSPRSSRGRLRGPTTLDELIALTEEIAASGKKPWCAASSPVTPPAGRDRLGRGHDAAHRRRGDLRPVGQPRDPVRRPGRRRGVDASAPS
jgi:alpha-glucoside transport system substrate-binding protein